MKKAFLISLLIIGNALFYIGCDPCADTESSPNYYLQLTGLDAEHFNPENKDTVLFSNYGLSVKPQTQQKFAAIQSVGISQYAPGLLHACDPVIGSFFGYQPNIVKLDIITVTTFDDDYGAGDTITDIVYREIYGSQQYIADINAPDIPENFFDGPFKFIRNPIDSVLQQYNVVFQLIDGTKLEATTGPLYIR